MRKWNLFSLCALLIVLAVTGCSLEKPPEGTTKETSASIPVTTDVQIVTARKIIQRSEQIGDVTVVINTSEPVLEAHDPEIVKLEFDEENWLQMGSALLEERFPQVMEDLSTGQPDVSSSGSTGALLVTYSRETREDRAGWMGFLDVENNINGKMLDAGSAPGTPDYITEIAVPGLDFSGEEAAQRVAELLEQYSCFTFTPWNVYAVYEAETQRGFYKVTLRPCFEEMPLYSQDKITTLSVGYSASGMFECQGILLLKEAQSVLLENSLSVEDAVEVFLSASPLYAYGESVSCNRIFPGYVASPADSAVTLSPAWIFECTDTGISGSYFCAVDMGSGTLLNVG